MTNYGIAEAILEGLDRDPSDTRSDQLLEALIHATLAVSDAIYAAVVVDPE